MCNGGRWNPRRFRYVRCLLSLRVMLRLVSLVLVDFPNTARFLTPEERAFVIHKKSAASGCVLFAHVWLIEIPSLEYDNSSVGEEEHFAIGHLVAALSDWQVWLHILIYVSITGPSMRCSAALECC